MEIEVAIETDDQRLLNDLFENTSSRFEPGYQKRLPNGIDVLLKSHVRRRGVGIPPESITLLLSLGTSIATNILSTWLYEKLKGRTIKLHISREETRVEEKAIERVVEESIENQQ